MAGKSDPGNFFEDFSVGQTLTHPNGRTITEGDCALYLGLTGDRYPLFSDATFARACGYRRELVHDVLVFHVVFGKTVPDVSRNAQANLGYADLRFVQPVYPGDTLRAESKVVGKRENRNGKTGIVYVHTRGTNAQDETVLEFYRWVMVRKKDVGTRTGEDDVPELPKGVDPTDLGRLDLPTSLAPTAVGLCFGGPHALEDYEAGERIFHGSGVTIEDAEHATATRLYQNTATVHVDGYAMAATGTTRLVYGGHVISLARALSYNGLENAHRILAWNGGTHANPTHAGDTVYAFTDVVEAARFPGREDLGALRLRTYAAKNRNPEGEPFEPVEVDGEKRKFHAGVVLELDYWVALPTRAALSRIRG